MGLGSGIQDPGAENRDSRSEIQDGGKNLFRIPRSKSHRMPDPQHWLEIETMF